MKRNTKSLLALLLVLLMVMSAFGGCGTAPAATESSSAPAESSSAAVEESSAAVESTEAAPSEAPALEEYEIVYYMLANTISKDRDMIVEKLNEMTKAKINATVNIVMLDWGTWTDKFNTGINAGEKMDIAFTADWFGYLDSVANGYFLALNDPADNLLEQYAPETVAALGEGFIKGSRIGGMNYAVPTDKEFAVNSGLVWNKDLADKYGFDMTKVKTIADLEPMLKTIKEKEPNIIPYLIDGQGFINPFTDLSGGANIGVDYADITDKTMKHVWEMPVMIEKAKTNKKFMDAGYISKDAPTDNAKAGDHLLAGDFFVTEQPLKPGKGKSTELMAAAGNKFKLDEYDWTPYVAVSMHAGGSMLAIPQTSGDPARAMMFINLMHTDPDIANLLVWGIEGTHHKAVGTSGIGEKIVEALPDNAWTSASLPWTLGSVYIHWLGSNEPENKHEMFQLSKTQSKSHISLGYRFTKKADYQPQYAALSNVMAEYDRVLATGAVKDFDATYKEFMDKMKAAGLDEVKAALQADLDAYVAK